MKTTYHTLIIGTGCAGYLAAERLYDMGVRNVAILTEGRRMGTSRNTGSDKQTYYKLSLCGGDGDSVREMAQTLFDGGAVNGDTALCEAAYSTRCFMHLVELGVPFPTNEYGEYAGYKTDHDPRCRATSCGPLTSKYMTEALERAVSTRDIPILDGYLAVEILTEGGEVRGLAAVDVHTGACVTFSCRNIVLCTGGPACVYAHTVYPESQHGGTGLAVAAGATMANLDQWQYGIASTSFRWNLSGTYQQVLPRYVSVDTDGVEREFLYDALGTESLGLIFLKGYQCPFDTRKMDGSSRVDLLVADETRRGRRVYLDFTRNPKGLEDGFSVLPEEAYTYLSRSGALFGTPIERLAHMNRRAVALYADHGIDLATEWLPIAVCAQHCNGGVAIDAHWQSDVRGLYVTGEAAGNFGVYRPGGSALNATQVGSLRAAEHIAAQYDAAAVANGVAYTPIPIRRGENNLDSIRAEVQGEMSRVADFSRDTGAMEALLARVSYLCDHLFEIACVSETREIADWYRLRDMLLTVREVLSAMLCSAREIGSHGASYIVGDDRIAPDAPRRTRTLTRGGLSRIEPVMPIPDAELWFETLLARLTFHGDESVTQRCQDETIRNR